MSCSPRQPVARGAARGFSLVEAVVATALVAIMLSVAMTLVGASAISRGTSADRARAMALAEDLMSEILGRPYVDSEPTGNDSFLGIETGEATAIRLGFDDVDDYDGWSSQPPQKRDGTLLADLVGWERSVAVRWAEPQFLHSDWNSSTGVKRITVTVSRNGKPMARLTAIRTHAWVDDETVNTARGVLLVVSDATSPTDQDTARKNLLESWDYKVMLISASDTQANFDEALALSTVAYVVEQQQSTVLGTKLRDAAVGVVNEEVELRVEFGFCSNRDWPAPTDSINVIDNSHYMTSPFPIGWLQVCTGSEELINLAGNIPPGLRTLSQIVDPASNLSPGMAVIDSGGELYGGGTAAARRVQLPWGRVGFDINGLNTDGQTIMQRAVEWAAGEDQP
jgi:type II secretory pathway pseudopilin PulG